MGLPVVRTKILIYTFSGFCSALAGVTFTFYMLSGYGLHAQGLEMDAIAAAVVGAEVRREQNPAVPYTPAEIAAASVAAASASSTLRPAAWGRAFCTAAWRCW